MLKLVPVGAFRRIVSAFLLTSYLFGCTSWRLQQGGVGSPGTPVKPSRLIRFMTGAGGAMVAQIHGIRGLVLHLSAASVSAMCAIGEACEKILAGTVDVVLAGGAEAPLDREVVETLRAAGILASDPADSPACRPFDERRSGTTLGEGAGAFILESASHAAARGAPLRARISGYGLVCEQFSLTGPDPHGTGVFEAIEQALSGIDSANIGWIKSHGTGTRSNDAAECAGLARVFDGRLAQIPITSLKSTVGHCLGASGAVEAVATLLAMEAGIIPATLGTTRPDAALGPVRIVTGMRECRAEKVVLLAESFGGRCAALVLGAA